MVVSEDNRLLDLATTPVRLNLPPAPSEVAELLSPIAYIAPGQLFAQYLALERGFGPRPTSESNQSHRARAEPAA